MPAEGQPLAHFHVYDADNNYIEGHGTEDDAKDQAESIGGVVVRGGGPQGQGGDKLHDFRSSIEPPTAEDNPELLSKLEAVRETNAAIVEQHAAVILAGMVGRPDFSPGRENLAINLAISVATKLHAACSLGVTLEAPKEQQEAVPKRVRKVVNGRTIYVPAEQAQQ